MVIIHNEEIRFFSISGRYFLYKIPKQKNGYKYIKPINRRYLLGIIPENEKKIQQTY